MKMSIGYLLLVYVELPFMLYLSVTMVLVTVQNPSLKLRNPD